MQSFPELPAPEVKAPLGLLQLSAEESQICEQQQEKQQVQLHRLHSVLRRVEDKFVADAIQVAYDDIINMSRDAFDRYHAKVDEGFKERDDKIAELQAQIVSLKAEDLTQQTAGMKRKVSGQPAKKTHKKKRTNTKYLDHIREYLPCFCFWRSCSCGVPAR